MERHEKKKKNRKMKFNLLQNEKEKFYVRSLSEGQTVITLSEGKTAKKIL